MARKFIGFSGTQELHDWINEEAKRQNRTASNLIQTILLKEKERLEREAEKNRDIKEKLRSCQISHRASWNEPE